MRNPVRVADRGFALLVVVVILLLVSFLASQLIMQVRTELKMAANTDFRTTARMLAESGVNLALFRLLDKPETLGQFDQTDFVLGRSYATDLPAGKINYYAVSETGKINLNSGSTGLLRAFLEYEGLKPDEIDVVLDSLADWRDSDSLQRLHGAEQDYYQSLVPPYSPRNGDLEDASEFFLIRGTDGLQGRFDPYEVFSVSSRSAAINFNSLTPAMIDFLVEGDQARLDRYREMKDSGLKLTMAQIQEILGADRFAELRSYLRTDLRSNQYSVVATGFAARGKRTVTNRATGESSAYYPGVVVRVLVELGGNGFNNLSWRERNL